MIQAVSHVSGEPPPRTGLNALTYGFGLAAENSLKLMATTVVVVFTGLELLNRDGEAHTFSSCDALKNVPLLGEWVKSGESRLKSHMPKDFFANLATSFVLAELTGYAIEAKYAHAGLHEAEQAAEAYHALQQDNAHLEARNAKLRGHVPPRDPTPDTAQQSLEDIGVKKSIYAWGKATQWGHLWTIAATTVFTGLLVVAEKQVQPLKNIAEKVHHLPESLFEQAQRTLGMTFISDNWKSHMGTSLTLGGLAAVAAHIPPLFKGKQVVDQAEGMYQRALLENRALRREQEQLMAHAASRHGDEREEAHRPLAFADRVHAGQQRGMSPAY